MSAFKCDIYLWYFFILQCFGTIEAEGQHDNVSEKMLNIDVSLQHSSDSSTSTIVAIDPVKSFLLWTIIEAVALGLITTIAIERIHSHHTFRPYFYHYPYAPPSKLFDDFDYIRKTAHNFPVVTDIQWPLESKLYLSFKPNKTEIQPCKSSSRRKCGKVKQT